MFRPAHRADNGGPDGPARRRGPRVRPDHPMLLLFDIDGTLIRTRGAGMRALEDAGRGCSAPVLRGGGGLRGKPGPGHRVTNDHRGWGGSDTRPDGSDPVAIPRACAGTWRSGRRAGDCGAAARRVIAAGGPASRAPRLDPGAAHRQRRGGARLKLEHCGIDHDGFLVASTATTRPTTRNARTFRPWRCRVPIDHGAGSIPAVSW